MAFLPFARLEEGEEVQNLALDGFRRGFDFFDEVLGEGCHGAEGSRRAEISKTGMGGAGKCGVRMTDDE